MQEDWGGGVGGFCSRERRDLPPKGRGLAARAPVSGGSAGRGRGLAARAQCDPVPVPPTRCAMDFGSARRAVLQLLGTTAPADVPALLHWMRTTRKRSQAGARRFGAGFDLSGPGGAGRRVSKAAPERRTPRACSSQQHFRIGCLRTNLRWFCD